MTARLDLLAHGASSATRAARFSDDEGLEASAVGALEALRSLLRHYDRALAARARAARETAAALALEAEVDSGLTDCDCGRWRGLALTDVAEREPQAFAVWLADPSAAPHGGESVAALIARAGAWLDEAASRDGATLAVTHAAFIRACVVAVLGAPPAAFWRIDVAPLALARLSGREGRWNLVALGALGTLGV